MSAALSSYRIYGRITDQDKPLANVLLELGAEPADGGPNLTYTSASGNYQFTGLASKTYILKPRKPAFKFVPPQVTVGPQTADFNQDFTAIVDQYELSGTTADSSGVPLSGVTLTLSGKETKTTSSDETGNYKFLRVTGAGSYTISPDKTGYTFTPPSIPILYLANDLKHSFYGSTAGERDRPPSQWTVLNDYSKTMITLASGLLVVSVTFSSQLAGKNWISNLLLSLTWLALLGTIVCGVLTNVYTIQFLRNNIEGGRAVRFANGSYLMLGLAAVLFLAFGGYAVWFANKTWDLGVSIEQASKALREPARANYTWNLQSIQWQEETKRYRFFFVRDGTSEKALVEVDPEKNRVTRLDALPQEIPPANSNTNTDVDANANARGTPSPIAKGSKPKRH